MLDNKDNPMPEQDLSQVSGGVEGDSFLFCPVANSLLVFNPAYGCSSAPLCRQRGVSKDQCPWHCT